MGEFKVTICRDHSNMPNKARAANPAMRMWPVEDLIDAVGMSVVTRKRLMDHFVAIGKRQISLRELMGMCLDGQVEGLDFITPNPRLRA